MIRIHYLGSSSACFELDNHVPYYSPAPYEVLLNGEAVLQGSSNVFSLFSLRPDTAYRLELRMEGAAETLEFRTAAEQC